MEELKARVANILVTKWDMSFDRASSVIEEAFKASPDMWHETTDADELAEYLATEFEGE